MFVLFDLSSYINLHGLAQGRIALYADLEAVGTAHRRGRGQADTEDGSLARFYFRRCSNFHAPVFAEYSPYTKG